MLEEKLWRILTSSSKFLARLRRECVGKFEPFPTNPTPPCPCLARSMHCVRYIRGGGCRKQRSTKAWLRCRRITRMCRRCSAGRNRGRGLGIHGRMAPKEQSDTNYSEDHVVRFHFVNGSYRRTWRHFSARCSKCPQNNLFLECRRVEAPSDVKHRTCSLFRSPISGQDNRRRRKCLAIVIAIVIVAIVIVCDCDRYLSAT